MTMTLGIAFSTDHCHGLLLQHEKNSFLLKKAKSFQHVFEEHAALSSVAHAFKAWTIKQTRIIIGIPSQKIIQRQFTFDSTLSDTQIMHFLKERSLDLFGFHEKEIRLDYEKNKTLNDQKEITVVATHKKLIDHFQHAFQQNGMSIHAIDVNTFAIAHLHEKLTLKKHYFETHTFENFLGHFFINETGLQCHELQDFFTSIALCLWSHHEH